MNIKPIRSEQDYDLALAKVDHLFEAKPNTPAGDKLDVLVTLIEAYEEKHYVIELPDPIDAIKHIMDSRGLTRKDLESCMGTRARISEILNRKRKLTLPMIRKLHKTFNIPARVLIQA